jgi:predicted nucleic acid-binding protein
MIVTYEVDLFIDSNIWLYALSKDTVDKNIDRKRKIAISLTQREGIVVSTQIVNEVCANAIKKLSFVESEVLELIQDFYEGCIVIEQNHALLVEASNLRIRHRFSFWDSLIVAAALQSNVKILYSEDMQDGLRVNNQLEINNPFK